MITRFDAGVLRLQFPASLRLAAQRAAVEQYGVHEAEPSLSGVEDQQIAVVGGRRLPEGERVVHPCEGEAVASELLDVHTSACVAAATAAGSRARASTSSFVRT